MANEKRLIDADALHEELVYNTTRTGIGGCDCITVWRVADAIVNAPTVDAVEVVHGRWMHKHFDDVCGGWYNKWCCSVCEGSVYENGFNYCPNCGAKMDGGNEDG